MQRERIEAIVNEMVRGHERNKRLLEKLHGRLRREREEERRDGIDRKEDTSSASRSEQEQAEPKKEDPLPRKTFKETAMREHEDQDGGRISTTDQRDRSDKSRKSQAEMNEIIQKELKREA